LPPERELAEKLHVSRSSVREALRDLESRGMLERRPGLGTRVLDPGATARGRALAAGLEAEHAELLQVMELRSCIEPALAGRAAAKATSRDLAQLRGLLEKMSLAGEAQEFSVLDRTFHRAIAQCTYNPLLLRLFDLVHELAEPSRRIALVTPQRMQSSIQEHMAILRAIEAGDPGAAVRAAAEHVDSVQGAIKTLLLEQRLAAQPAPKRDM
jgi:GntR family transcriptional repressor for pyruvate dehydrogenase complex